LITLRKLTDGDKGQFNKLIVSEAFDYEAFLNMGWCVNQIINQLNKNTNFSYGVFDNRSLVSFILGDLLNIEKISEYEILLIYVVKKYRNKGIARKLINKIEEKNSCLKKIYLEVAKNNHQAMLFYKKMNFKKINIRKNYFCINGKKIDALQMAKTY